MLSSDSTLPHTPLLESQPQSSGCTPQSYTAGAIGLPTKLPSKSAFSSSSSLSQSSPGYCSQTSSLASVAYTTDSSTNAYAHGPCFNNESSGASLIAGTPNSNPFSVSACFQNQTSTNEKGLMNVRAVCHTPNTPGVGGDGNEISGTESVSAINYYANDTTSLISPSSGHNQTSLYAEKSKLESSDLSSNAGASDRTAPPTHQLALGQFKLCYRCKKLAVLQLTPRSQEAMRLESFCVACSVCAKGDHVRSFQKEHEHSVCWCCLHENNRLLAYLQDRRFPNLFVIPPKPRCRNIYCHQSLDNTRGFASMGLGMGNLGLGGSSALFHTSANSSLAAPATPSGHSIHNFSMASASPSFFSFAPGHISAASTPASTYSLAGSAFPCPDCLHAPPPQPQWAPWVHDMLALLSYRYIRLLSDEDKNTVTFYRNEQRRKEIEIHQQRAAAVAGIVTQGLFYVGQCVDPQVSRDNFSKDPGIHNAHLHHHHHHHQLHHDEDFAAPKNLRAARTSSSGVMAPILSDYPGQSRRISSLPDRTQPYDRGSREIKEAMQQYDAEDRVLQERIDRTCCIRGDLIRYPNEYAKRACAGANAVYITAHPLQRDSLDYSSFQDQQHSSTESRLQRFILLDVGPLEMSRLLGDHVEDYNDLQLQHIRARFCEQVRGK